MSPDTPSEKAEVRFEALGASVANLQYWDDEQHWRNTDAAQAYHLDVALLKARVLGARAALAQVRGLETRGEGEGPDEVEALQCLVRRERERKEAAQAREAQLLEALRSSEAEVDAANERTRRSRAQETRLREALTRIADAVDADRYAPAGAIWCADEARAALSTSPDTEAQGDKMHAEALARAFKAEAQETRLREALEREWLKNHARYCNSGQLCDSFGGDAGACLYPRAALSTSPDTETRCNPREGQRPDCLADCGDNGMYCCGRNDPAPPDTETRGDTDKPADNDGLSVADDPASPDTETRGEAIDRITGCWHSTPRCDACRPAPPDTAPPEGATFTGADRRALLRLAERLQLQSEEADDAGAQVWAARYRSEHYAIHRVLAALDGPASAPPASEGEAVKAIESEARRFAQKGGKFNEAKALGLAEAAHILRTFAPVEGETREWTIPVCEGCDFPEIGAGETECPDCELPVEWIVVRYMRPAPEPKGGRVPAPTEARAEGEAG